MMKEVIDHLCSQNQSIKPGDKKDVSFYLNDTPVLFKAVPGTWQHILFESWNGPGRIGWLLRGNVEIFAYYMAEAGTLYLIDVQAVRLWINKTQPNEQTGGSNGGKYYKIHTLALKNADAIIEIINL